MDETISNAILKTLNECGPSRALKLDPLTTYVNAHLPAYAERNTVQSHLNSLERSGFVRHESSPVSPNVFSYSITPAGQAIAATLI